MAGSAEHATDRDYASLRGRALDIARLPTREERMEAFVALWWDAFAATGISWVGFYVDHPGEPDDRRMTLAARRPKPACSPIGVHGACGQCLLAGRTLVVRDVRDLGEGYIACDPRDQSELVVPCTDSRGHPWGVLDVDSHAVASFSTGDGEAALELLALAGLTQPGIGS